MSNEKPHRAVVPRVLTCKAGGCLLAYFLCPIIMGMQFISEVQTPVVSVLAKTKTAIHVRSRAVSALFN